MVELAEILREIQKQVIRDELWIKEYGITKSGMETCLIKCVLLPNQRREKLCQ
jgi:hypothetical protein